MNSPHLFAITLAAAALLTTGCHITEHKNGDNKNVDISTPFGGMHVNTNDKVDVAATGLTPYPGATLWPSEGKDHDKSADVDMSFGDFHLRVKAAAYRTTDSVDKITAFYKKDLARYGEVLTCHGNATVGQPTRTSQGLTCNDKDKGNHITTDATDGNDLELRAGSPQHQHVVGITPKDGATKIGLVALDLPGHIGHKNEDSE